MHPRLQTRRHLVALGKAQDELLADFDRLIHSLNILSQHMDRFSKLGVIARSVRSELILLEVGSREWVVFILGIEQQIADFVEDLLEFEPVSDISPAASKATD